MAAIISLPPPPYASPLVDQGGMITPGWSKWIQQLYSRVGESSALSNIKIGGVTAIALAALPVGNTNTTVYTSPTGQDTIIDSFTATNTALVAQTLSVNLVPVGQLPAGTNLVASSVSIPASSTVTITGAQGQVLGSGAFVNCIASATGAILIHISGRRVS